jgi:hypothetical protein
MRGNDLVRCIGALLMEEPWFQWVPGMLDRDHRRVIVPMDEGNTLHVVQLGERDVVEARTMAPPNICDFATWACMIALSEGKMLTDDLLTDCFAEIEAIKNPDFATIKRRAAAHLGFTLSDDGGDA